MTEERVRTCAYRILRYTPNLIRDEWLNIGVLLHDPTSDRLWFRLIEDDEEFARIRRLHPEVDLELLRALPPDFERQIAGADSPGNVLARLGDTWSNTLQLGPQKGVVTQDTEAELDRLYRDHVEPPRARIRPASEVGHSRAGIRVRARQVFQQAGVLNLLQQRIPVEEFTETGDPLRIDFAYRRNGTRGFIHSLSLAHDPAHAKVLTYTAERIHNKLPEAALFAVTDVASRPGDSRQEFVGRLLASQHIEVVALPEIEGFAARLRSWLM